MKFRTTLVLFGLFILLLAAVYFFEFRSQGEKSTADMLVSVSTDNVEKIIFTTDGQTIQFQKEDEEWMITDTIEAKADKVEVSRLADDFTNLRIERVVEEEPSDLEKYGIPQKQVELFFRDQERGEKILIGLENPLDNTFFAKKAEDTRVVLIPSSLKSLLEKKVFDFRQKNIFQFESDQVIRVKLDAGGIHWEAEIQSMLLLKKARSTTSCTLCPILRQRHSYRKINWKRKSRTMGSISRTTWLRSTSRSKTSR